MHQVRIEPSILPFGQHPGALFGKLFMIISSSQSALTLCHPRCLTSGFRALNPGTFKCSPPPLPRPLKQSLPFSPLLVTAKISFVGHPQRLVSALLRTSTTIYLYNSRSIYLYMVPGVFSLEPTIFCSVCGKVRTYLLSSKRSPGGS
jgi:hypothetical protein